MKNSGSATNSVKANGPNNGIAYGQPYLQNSNAAD